MAGTQLEAGDLANGRYLITGATGRTGRRAVRRLVEAGATVRTLLHTTPPDRLSTGDAAIDLFWGDVADRDSLFRATRGVDWVIATAPGNARHLVDAAAANGVRHLVLLTSRMADERWDFMPTYPARARDERYLAASGLPFTILRPGGIVDPDDGQPFPAMSGFVRDAVSVQQFGPPSLPAVYVFTDELAEFAVRAHAYRQTWGRTFDVGGPDTPTRDQLWTAIGEAVTAAPIVRYAPVDELIRLRMEAETAGDRALAMRLAREEVAAQIDLPAPDMAAMATLFGGVPQRNLRDWLRQSLASLEP